jgi:hypothetical protein
MSRTTTDAQIHANQLNALLSTGPRSEEGKRKVSMNAVKHGFSGHSTFVPEHLKEDFARHFEEFKADWNPKGRTEAFLVHSLAQISWSLQNIRTVSNSILSLLGAKSSPWETGDPEQDFLAAQATHIGDQMRQLDLLSLYEQRKTRLFHSTREQLARIQNDRQAIEQKELETCSILRRSAQRAFQPGQPEWQPSHDGFACSLAEVDRFQSIAERLQATEHEAQRAF